MGGQVPRVESKTGDQALRHRNDECSAPTRRFDGNRRSKDIVLRMSCPIKNQLDDSSPSKYLALLYDLGPFDHDQHPLPRDHQIPTLHLTTLRKWADSGRDPRRCGLAVAWSLQESNRVGVFLLCIQH